MKHFVTLFGSFALAILAIGGLIYMVTAWISDNFGELAAGAFWLMLFGALMLFLGVCVAGWIQTRTLDALADFQAADDRGEIARANVIKEMVRGQREFDRDVRRAAGPMAKQYARVIYERKQLEAQNRAAQDTDDWYVLPEVGDE